MAVIEPTMKASDLNQQELANETDVKSENAEGLKEANQDAESEYYDSLPRIYADQNIAIYYENIEKYRYDNDQIDIHFFIHNKTNKTMNVSSESLAVNGESLDDVMWCENIPAHSYRSISVTGTVDIECFELESFLNIKNLSGKVSVLIGKTSWYSFVFENISLGDGIYTPIEPAGGKMLVYQNSDYEIYFLRTKHFDTVNYGLVAVFRIKNKGNKPLVISANSITINGTLFKDLISFNEIMSGCSGNITVDLDNEAKEDSPFLNVNVLSGDFSVDYNQVKFTNISPNQKRWNQIEEFVARLYQKILNRSTDPDGLVYHTNILMSRTITAIEDASGFIFSEEFKNRNLSNSDYLEVLYQAFMNRASDKEGKAYWLKRLENGVSREGVFKGFAESVEFTNICNDYGIDRGTAPLSEDRDQNPNLTMFIFRLYDKALERKAEVDGLNYYCKEIREKRVTPVQAAQNFIFSNEFENKKLDEAEYVKVLYRTFMGREYDSAGLKYHLNRMNNGVGRDDILKGFAYSPEFKSIMESFGL